MTDDKTEWVTVKVPKVDKERAKEKRPDGTTFGDCLRAGAESLAEGPSTQMTAQITPTVDEEKLDALVDEIKGRLSEADPIDDIGSQLDRIEDAATTAEERTGSIERTLEGFQ